jgi:hypothetical protein
MTISIEWRHSFTDVSGCDRDSAGTATVQVKNFVGSIRSFDAFYRKDRLRRLANRSAQNSYAAGSSIVCLWIGTYTLSQ